MYKGLVKGKDIPKSLLNALACNYVKFDILLSQLINNIKCSFIPLIFSISNSNFSLALLGVYLFPGFLNYNNNA